MKNYAVHLGGTGSMKHKKIIIVLVILIIALSALATVFGILSNDDNSQYIYTSIRGEEVVIHGAGVYKHMSADVAIQGIAQDYITLFVGIPLLSIALYFAMKGSTRGLFILSGVLGYFLLTYLFYTAMAMYNVLFLAYVFLLGFSLFAFILSLSSYSVTSINDIFLSKGLIRKAGIFLIINSTMIGLLWLGSIIPPLIDGTVYPNDLQHYTTLIVQGFDLGIFLPMGFVAGISAIKNKSYGYLFTTIYIIFLVLLMSSLTSKIIFMANAGANVIPAIFVMPAVGLISLVFSILLIRNICNAN